MASDSGRLACALLPLHPDHCYSGAPCHRKKLPEDEGGKRCPEQVLCPDGELRHPADGREKGRDRGADRWRRA